MVTTKNLCNHAIRLVVDGQVVVYVPSGHEARCVYEERICDTLGNAPIKTQHCVHISGLPEPREGVYLIVSQDVAKEAARQHPERDDIIHPREFVWENGKKVGCRSWGKAIASQPKKR